MAWCEISTTIFFNQHGFYLLAIEYLATINIDNCFLMFGTDSVGGVLHAELLFFRAVVGIELTSLSPKRSK